MAPGRTGGSDRSTGCKFRRWHSLSAKAKEVPVLKATMTTKLTRSQAKDRGWSSSSREAAGPRTRSRCRRPRTASREADRRTSRRSRSLRLEGSLRASKTCNREPGHKSGCFCSGRGRAGQKPLQLMLRLQWWQSSLCEANVDDGQIGNQPLQKEDRTSGYNILFVFL